MPLGSRDPLWMGPSARAKVGVPGWLEAFAAHPRIGDVGSLKKKFASTAEWCGQAFVRATNA